MTLQAIMFGTLAGLFSIVVVRLIIAENKLKKMNEQSVESLLASIEKRATDEVDNLSDDELLRLFNERYKPRKK